ncbi:hypothetical protein [Xylocopilactobacillus apis]|uniref:Transposase n=1 Tax=Xylocopilactobacillus apis TaxID=2932183 RepID=A0AAU9CSW0_9LACO|nr:hypothetical protein [Xylocopilactobacillus apis]BDR55446.1 hypothetical protein KIMC2_00080 [Xylocopilactobacillus apis]BDR57489.1 hypothetical protein KIMC2_20510 [Xylocopilactobacillus apis]
MLNHIEKMKLDYESGLETQWTMGRAEGKVEGRAEGKVQGKVEGKQEFARKLMNKGMSIQEISDLTDLSIEEIEKLK